MSEKYKVEDRAGLVFIIKMSPLSKIGTAGGARCVDTREYHTYSNNPKEIQ